jgi:hypothetical protein
MSRNNDVFQVLVPTVATPAATGSTLAALAQGAIGAFSYETNLALDPAAKATEDFYFAVKIKDLDGVDDLNKSAGTHIQVKNIIANTNKVYTAPVNMVTGNLLKVITCGDEIGVKIEIRNQEAYRLNGYNQVVKNFMVPTSECTDCDSSCEDLSCIAILTSLVDLINSDPDGVVTATQVAPDAACDGGVTGAQGKLILTVNPVALKDFCTVNLNYFFPHQTEIIVTSLEGFEATTIDTAMVFEDGAGYDIKQLEYEAGGWNGKPGPYRVYNDGFPQAGYQYFADVAKNYDVQQIQHDQFSISGWRGDLAFERTVIASETGATGTAIAAFVAAVIG